MEWETNEEIMISLANRLKKIRKIKKISQMQLAKTSNVSYGSIKRFESSGEISLKSLLALCDVLDVKDEIKNLFTKQYYKDINEVING